MTSLTLEALASLTATRSWREHDERLQLHAADGVLAWLAGERVPEGAALQALFARHDTGPLGRAASMAAVMRLTEIDDIHRPTAVTATAIALPAVLAMGQPTDTSHFLDAFCAGHEAAVRVAHAMGGARMLAAGLWPSYVVAPVAAAAAAGRALGLAPDRMTHALALALAQTPRTPGKSSGSRPGRWLVFGNAVRAGCMAALAAADGVDGDPGLMSPAWLATMGGGQTAAGELGDGPVIEQSSIKPHCSAKQALAAIHAMRSLLQGGIAPDSITDIELQVPGAYSAMIDREPPSASRIASMVSARWQLALTALHPEGLDDVARASLPEDPALHALAERVRIVADPTLDALYPLQWPARLAVTARGQRHTIEVKDSPGDPSQRYDAGQLLDKAERMLGRHPDGALVARMLNLSRDPRALYDLYLRHAHPIEQEGDIR
jgi:2-methylcitrate dehydratase PrpD